MSAATWLEAPGTLVPAPSLSSGKARNLADHLTANADYYSCLVECRTDAETDVVVFDTEVSVPQGGSKYDIHELERIAVRFLKSDRRMPEILALRPTFPRLSHQNLATQEIPRRLCVTDWTYGELRRRWSSRLLLQLIREWLRRAAHGELHQEDQPLEPFFLGTGAPFIVPRDIFRRVDSTPLHVLAVGDGSGEAIGAYVTAPAGGPETPQLEIDKNRILALVIKTTPAEHGVIRRRPQTLEDVIAVLDEIGFDLMVELRRRLRAWKNDSSRFEGRVTRLALILWIPKKRKADDILPEAMDMFALVTTNSVVEVGEDVGAWETERIGGTLEVASIVGIGDNPTNDNRGRNCEVSLFPVVLYLDRLLAAAYERQQSERRQNPARGSRRSRFTGREQPGPLGLWTPHVGRSRHSSPSQSQSTFLGRRPSGLPKVPGHGRRTLRALRRRSAYRIDTTKRPVEKQRSPSTDQERDLRHRHHPRPKRFCRGEPVPSPFGF